MKAASLIVRSPPGVVVGVPGTVAPVGVVGLAGGGVATVAMVGVEPFAPDFDDEPHATNATLMRVRMTSARRMESSVRARLAGFAALFSPRARHRLEPADGRD